MHKNESRNELELTNAAVSHKEYSFEDFSFLEFPNAWNLVEDTPQARQFILALRIFIRVVLQTNFNKW